MVASGLVSLRSGPSPEVDGDVGEAPLKVVPLRFWVAERFRSQERTDPVMS
jgi:hypothetical protein